MKTPTQSEFAADLRSLATTPEASAFAEKLLATPPALHRGRQIIGDAPRSVRWTLYSTEAEEAALKSRATRLVAEGAAAPRTRSEVIRLLLGL